MPLKLNRQVVAEKYEATVDVDVNIHIGCYNGPLSNINECGAAALVKTGTDYLRLRPEADIEP